MAEIRKHRPRSAGSIADQVRANIDAGPRPVTPGEPAVDPFFDEDAEQTTVPASYSFGVTSLESDGWFALTPDALDALHTPKQPAAEADDPDED